MIIQNDIGNKHSPTVICAAITSKMNKAKLPTHIEIDAKKVQAGKEFSRTVRADPYNRQTEAQGAGLSSRSRTNEKS